MDQVEACDLLLKRLGYKKTLEHSKMHTALKTVHQTIYKRLHDLKYHGVRSILNHSLYEMLPETQA